ncbi:MAG: pyridoxamine 5'-phosphate oxidase family protein [Zoogloeaceae bacterium]|nr:pyridoxamine 5'-phosphate oxidase family protein [Zoogloeaceae bacterium]
MTQCYTDIAFTSAVRQTQEANGTREHGRRLEARSEARLLGDRERAFIAGRDSFFLATVNQAGWPYVQHRGGAPGFLKVLGPSTLGFADFRGNLQYVSTGNLATDDRVSLILVDYPRRWRLKIFGRARILELDAAPVDLAQSLTDAGYDATVERLTLIEIEAFDWNCSQHIPQRFSRDELAPLIHPLEDRIAQLEACLRAAGIEPPPHP